MVFLDDFPAAALGNLAKFAQLVLNGLFVRRYSDVNRDFLHRPLPLVEKCTPSNPFQNQCYLYGSNQQEHALKNIRVSTDGFGGVFCMGFKASCAYRLTLGWCWGSNTSVASQIHWISVSDLGHRRRNDMAARASLSCAPSGPPANAPGPP